MALRLNRVCSEKMHSVFSGRLCCIFSFVAQIAYTSSVRVNVNVHLSVCLYEQTPSVVVSELARLCPPFEPATTCRGIWEYCRLLTTGT